LNDNSSNADTAVHPTPIDASAVDAAIVSRRSVRGFLPAPIPRATVDDILRVAARAPSGTNIQPWRVHVLTGDGRQALIDALLHAYDHEAGQHQWSYDYYPTEWFEPYLARRRKIGWDLYHLLGITREDKAGMRAQTRRNFTFFGAPVGFIFTLHARLTRGAWLDCGMYLQNIMIAARARGLDTCPQAAFAQFPKVIARVLGLPDHESVVCGMAVGYADPAEPANLLRTERAPLDEFVTWHDGK
jgi:nitroreductase